MADDYFTCPHDALEDERLDGASLATISGYFVIVAIADDWGLFEGGARTLARRLGSDATEVDALFAELERRKLVRFYEATAGERVRRVGRVIDYHSYRGHPDRTAYESKRGASSFPFEDGTVALPRRQRGSDVEAPRQSRGTGVEETRKRRGSDVEAPRQSRGTAPARANKESGARPQTAQHSSEQCCAPNGAQLTAYVAPVSAPAEPALVGAGSGATENQPVPTTKAEPSAPPVQEYMRPDSPERPPDPGETWEAFKARYPWPTDADYAVDPWARTALNAEARARGVKPRELREAVTRERHGPPRVPLPDLPDDEVLH